MTDLIRPLVDRVEDVLSAMKGAVMLRWGTITSSAPLRVRLDTDLEPIPFKPATTERGLIIGDRVLCAVQNNRVIIIGASGTSQAGIIEIFAGTTPPHNTFMCDGSAVSRAMEPDLFLAIGTTFGQGNGSTTFNLPDLRGRVVAGVSSDVEFNSIGKKVGTKTHTMTVAESAPHGHAPAMGGAFWATGNANGTWPNSPAFFGGRWEGNNATANTGGGQPHNNIQPTIAMNYIIRRS